MAFQAAQGLINLKLGTSELRGGVGKIRGMLRGLGGTIGAGLGLAGIAAGIRSFVKEASIAEEVGSKFDAVFKDQAASARAFGAHLSGAVGRSSTELQGFLATMQDTFVPLGFARDRARDLSQQVVKLAVDLASFNNVADSDALASLQSSLVGNHETLRKFGVIINQAGLNQELLNMGVRGGAKAASEQEKAIARLNLILRSTTDAQGDATRTAGSFANQMRSLKAQWNELSIDLGKLFMPVILDVVKVLKGSVIPAVRQLVAGWNAMDERNRSLVKGTALLVASLTTIVLIAPSVLVAFRTIAIGITAIHIAATGGIGGITKLLAKVAIAGLAVAAAWALGSKMMGDGAEAMKAAKENAEGLRKTLAGLPTIAPSGAVGGGGGSTGGKGGAVIGIQDAFRKLQEAAFKTSGDIEKRKLHVAEKSLAQLERIARKAPGEQSRPDTGGTDALRLGM